MGWSEFRQRGLTHSDSNFSGGYTLVTPIGGKNSYLIDEEGCVVHKWHVEGFQPMYGHLLPNANLLVRGQPLVDTGTGTMEPTWRTADILLELDWNGNIIWRWENPAFHHDMCRHPNGNTLAIVWDLCDMEIARKVKGGYPSDQSARLWADPKHAKFFLGGLGVGGRPHHLKGPLSDAIVEVSPSGDVIHSWRAWENCDHETDYICPLEFPKEWTHCNSVKYIFDGKVLISFRETSVVMLIDWPDGNVLWKWGRDVISHQHDVTMTPEGNILIFDNGTHHPITPRSRVVEVDMETNKIVWQYNPSVVFSFFSGHIGGCERLPNGNTLICEGQSGRVFEVTWDCKVCWEWISPFIHPYKTVYASMLFRAHRYAADGPELQGRQMDRSKYEDLNRQLGLMK